MSQEFVCEGGPLDGRTFPINTTIPAGTRVRLPLIPTAEDPPSNYVVGEPDDDGRTVCTPTT